MTSFLARHFLMLFSLRKRLLSRFFGVPPCLGVVPLKRGEVAFFEELGLETPYFGLLR